MWSKSVLKSRSRILTVIFACNSMIYNSLSERSFLRSLVLLLVSLRMSVRLMPSIKFMVMKGPRPRGLSAATPRILSLGLAL